MMLSPRMTNRKRFLVYNSISSLVSQIVTIASGFLLTKLFISHYGSEINGMLASITQFLGFISLMEFGIGAVVKSTLYKPLAENDDGEISRIIISTRKFYKKIAFLLVIYSLVLCYVIPNFVAVEYEWVFSASLVVIIAVAMFAQYYFGIAYQLLLNADQKAYIPNIINCSTLFISTVISVFLIIKGQPIQAVKLTASVIFLFRPVLLSLYVKRHYNLDDSLKLVEEPIKQKWNGLPQHIAYVVVLYSSVVILTFMTSLSTVSIYTVYHGVVIGVQQLISGITVGFAAMIGNILYTENQKQIENSFRNMEWFFHFITILFFTITGILFIQFIRIYTEGITDADYIIPLFAVLITVSQALFSLRVPYETIILSANHFKQTQTSAIVEICINLSLSVILCYKFGIIGVCLGMIGAMCYRMLYFIIYLKNNILNYKIRVFVKQIIVDTFQVAVCVILAETLIPAYEISWSGFIIRGVEVSCICFLAMILINSILYNRETRYFISKVLHND